MPFALFPLYSLLANKKNDLILYNGTVQKVCEAAKSALTYLRSGEAWKDLEAQLHKLGMTAHKVTGKHVANHQKEYGKKQKAFDKEETKTFYFR